ncbi:hypothetical protein A359_09140 [secondary endosymbiont of Ctenarytaina eucalypti]|uniref:Uncharacterized protein n=1 Tax=secondary endosymbiont of Ctenarytaina eucalypti TaxID=1199245 RepID=J3TY63_9ENTR|nr:hypothetical protein A359_09140 [secondary endosymbiont of Ctenarytaina eucalypti]
MQSTQQRIRVSLDEIIYDTCCSWKALFADRRIKLIVLFLGSAQYSPASITTNALAINNQHVIGSNHTRNIQVAGMLAD